MPRHRRLPVHYLPAALAAVAASVLGGATFGESIGTDPVVRHEPAPRHSGTLNGEVDFRLSAAAPDTPDRYTLEAQSRRFGVGELAARGLYSQQRFGGASSPAPAYPAEREPETSTRPRPDDEPADGQAGIAIPQISPLPRLTLAE